ncbi:MAG: GNAT family N-acetyltransferase [Chloroflexi bacterium]|nr:GNAT family N-acetyltransferase [Chloroflexota bacterium]
MADLALLQIEIETLWTLEARGRILDGPALVLAATGSGCALALGRAVPDDLAVELAALVAGAAPPADLDQPPGVLDPCRDLLSAALGPLALVPESGPSYLIPEGLSFRADAALVRSDADERGRLRGANPGNWEADEWIELLEGRLGPWVMATHGALVMSICHTPRAGPRGAEAGVWTHPDFRGRGLAAAVTAAWATLIRPSGRYLFYSTARTNRSSQRVARRLGLRPLGWLWQLKLASRASYTARRG